MTMLLERDRPVLVTGASTGLGRAICEFLASNGHSVYAGVRKKRDFEELSKLPRVVSLQLDVTKPEEVEGAVKQVNEMKRGLHGLVNCAGVAGIGPLLDTPVEELNRVLGVNLIGVHRMIHAFGPLLVESHGRIVNISSIGGFLVDTWLGPYGTSKHALEGSVRSCERRWQRMESKCVPSSQLHIGAEWALISLILWEVRSIQHGRIQFSKTR